LLDLLYFDILIRVTTISLLKCQLLGLHGIHFHP
jgi:hypothetical protein